MPEYVICGDTKINYLTESEEKNQLEDLWQSYNLTSMVDFPTMSQKNSTTTMDNISIDIAGTDILHVQ
jgi:hypothetical protein